MKYFTYELWKDANNTDEFIRDRAHKTWMTNIEKYNNEFKILKNKLTKSFLNTLDKNDYFHDYYLSEIKVLQKNTGNHSTKLSIILTLDEVEWEIIYKNVVKVSINYSSEKNELGFTNG